MLNTLKPFTSIVEEHDDRDDTKYNINTNLTMFYKIIVVVFYSHLNDHVLHDFPVLMTFFYIVKIISHSELHT